MRVDSRKQTILCGFQTKPTEGHAWLFSQYCQIVRDKLWLWERKQIVSLTFLSLYDLDFPPKKLSGVFNYCWLSIHKRGSSQKHTSSCPLLQYIHCEEIIAQNRCFLFPPGWLLLGSCTVQPPLITSLHWIWSQLCPSLPWRPRHFATLHVQINLYSASGQQFALENLPKIVWEVHGPHTWSARTQWLVSGFSFRSWRGGIAPLGWLGGKFRERGPQGDPKFCFMPLEVTLVFFVHITQRSCNYGISIQR